MPEKKSSSDFDEVVRVIEVELDYNSGILLLLWIIMQTILCKHMP